MNSKKKVSAGLVCAVTLAFVATACGKPAEGSVKAGDVTESGDELYAAAKKEGKVSFYCAVVPEECQALAEGFEKSYPGIDVAFTRLTSSDLSARYAAEKSSKAPTADLVMSSDYAFVAEATSSGLLTSYAEAGYLPEDFPAEWVAGEVGVPFITELLGIAYNTDQVAKGEVTSYADLLDPRWKGKITNLDVETLPVASVLLGTVAAGQGGDYLTALAGQQVAPNTGGMVALTQSLGAGEFAIQMFASAEIVEAAAAKGSPVEVVFPEKATGSPFFFALNPEPANGYAQKLLAEYLISEDGNAALASSNEYVAAAHHEPGFDTVAPDLGFFDEAGQSETIATMTGR